MAAAPKVRITITDEEGTVFAVHDLDPKQALVARDMDFRGVPEPLYDAISDIGAAAWKAVDAARKAGGVDTPGAMY